MHVLYGFPCNVLVYMACYSSTYVMIEEVQCIRLKHSIPNLPMQYCFMLRCPFGIADNPFVLQSFLGGPAVIYIPLPIPDYKPRWGSKDCEKCQCECAPLEMSQPLTTISVVMQEAFQNLNGEPTSDFIEELARKMLPPIKVSFWIQQLQQVQKN